jgi:predicted dehydrogenase
MKRAEVRWGILGCGAVTEIKSGPAFQRIAKSRIVAVMRRQGDLAADYARRHGVPRWYDDPDRLLDDPEVDAVYVATPPGSHLAYALQACERGKPVYVEKPMARNHRECLRMIEAFAAANVPLFVAYYRRALPRFLKVKEMLGAGTLGTVTGVGVHFAGPYHRQIVADDALPWRLRAEESGGGLLLDLGSHTLDLLDFLLGPLTHATGTAANVGGRHDVEDSVVLQFRTARGALGTARWNFASDVRSDSIVIEGEEGQLRFATFGDDPIELVRGAISERFTLPNPVHIQEPLIATVVAALLGEGRCESTGTSAARTQAVMDTALETYYGGRSGDFWSNPARWPKNGA